MIKGLFDEEMPREKLISYGPKTLTEVELLAIILRVGTKEKNVIDLAREILDEIDFAQMSNKSFHELLKIKGINEVKAAQIISVIELSKRLSNRKTSKRVKIKSSNDAHKLVKYEMQDLKEEIVIAIFTDSRNQIIKKELISKGGLNYTLIDQRIIIKKAILLGAHGFFLFHNHPSGNPRPSIEDLNLTSIINDASKLFDIRFLDHIIIGDECYYSMYDMGDL